MGRGREVSRCVFCCILVNEGLPRGLVFGTPSVDCRRPEKTGMQGAARLSGCALCRLWSNGPIRLLRACGAARFACLQGKALGYPRRASLAPLDTTEPAEPDRPGQRPAAMDGVGEHAGACCGRLCECVPSSTLAVLAHRVTKDGSRTSRPASPWSFHATPQDQRCKVRPGRSRPSLGC